MEEETQIVPAASQQVVLVVVERSATSHRYPCIFRVPFDQRRVNPEAYTPKMIIIGPLHHAKKQEAQEMMREKCTSSEMEIIKHRYQQYLDMEEQKRLYFLSFCQRTFTEATSMLRYIERNEKRIRRCYGESTIWIGSSDFVELVLFDAIFIIEFMLRTILQEYHQDDLLLKTTSWNCIYNDLILLENQLPLFVLEELFDLTFGGDVGFPGVCLVFPNYPRDVGLMHFTDLLRQRKIKSLKSKSTKSGDKVRCSYNVEKLHNSGVHFVVKEGEDRNSIDVSFENKQLKLPKFLVYDSTEKKLRNIMALEQCYYEQEMHVCGYVIFLDSLIDTARDVGILVENGIIENHIGSDAVLADMVNKLSLGLVTAGTSCYADVAERLTKHHNRTWNRIMASLRHNYFDNVWKGTATIAGIFLLLLTLTQTVTSIIQVV